MSRLRHIIDLLLSRWIESIPPKFRTHQDGTTLSDQARQEIRAILRDELRPGGILAEALYSVGRQSWPYQ